MRSDEDSFFRLILDLVAWIGYLQYFDPSALKWIGSKNIQCNVTSQNNFLDETNTSETGGYSLNLQKQTYKLYSISPYFSLILFKFPIHLSTAFYSNLNSRLYKAIAR